eukprot:6490988-Amphidinium_carterae.5
MDQSRKQLPGRRDVRWVPTVSIVPEVSGDLSLASREAVLGGETRQAAAAAASFLLQSKCVTAVVRGRVA